MADIFVSYTSSDRQKAFWIGQELIKLGHKPRLHDWEISAGGNIVKWMKERHQQADHILLVVSKAYSTASFSNWEQQAAEWAAADKRPNFALPVFIEDCEAPTLSSIIKRCDLYGVAEEEARTRLKEYLTPAAPPSAPVQFWGSKASAAGADFKSVPELQVQPGSYYAVSNIPIAVPRHFLGRDDELAEIKAALVTKKGRAAITALYGLRGVGKTTLAAAYAEHYRGDYRATWWIRAQTDSTMRTDLVALGVQLGWVAVDEKEPAALDVVAKQLREEGDRILLIFDNANNPEEIDKYLPKGGAAQIIITSNAPNWSGVAEPVQVKTWPVNIGADFLLARTWRKAEREAAEQLSAALGGLPLAHEQAGAYCDRLGISLAEYFKRFETSAVRLMADAKSAPSAYHPELQGEGKDRLTVARTFELAIEEAAKLHPAAEPLIVHAALLAPEPIPLFLFAEAREEFGNPFAAMLADDGLDEAVAALRAFALIDRESIVDERDPATTTDCIRLHRLVRQVALTRCGDEKREGAREALIKALAKVHPAELHKNPEAWPRSRRLDAIALALLDPALEIPKGTEESVAYVLTQIADYRQTVLAAYFEARPLSERALAILEELKGLEDADTAVAANNLGSLLRDQGDLEGARPLFDRSLAIAEKALGPEHPHTAVYLNNLASLLRVKRDLEGARPLYERALAIREKISGPEHPETATCLNNLGLVLQDQGDLTAARLLLERALAIGEKTLGPEHPTIATRLNNLACLLQVQTEFATARVLFERALGIFDRVFGPQHPSTKAVAGNTAWVLDALGRTQEARSLREKY